MKQNLTTDKTNFLLEQTDGPNYQINGKMIGFVSNNDHHGCISVIYKLYKSSDGKYITQKIEGSGSYEESRSTIETKENEQDVVYFFGYSPLAKELYDQAKITHIEVVE